MPWLQRGLAAWGPQKVLGTVEIVICLLCRQRGLLAAGRAPATGWGLRFRAHRRSLHLPPGLALTVLFQQPQRDGPSLHLVCSRDPGTWKSF